MIESKKAIRQKEVQQKPHMPENSLFFEKVIPVLLIGMTVITVGLILFSAGVLLGLVNF